VTWIVRTLEDRGFETWTVGGAVRDALLGHPSGDWDLATRARPQEIRRVFERTVPVGVEHGTVGVIAPDRVMYEVTTFRRDVETDGRHAVVSFADRIEDDLARRDFTINAIAWHPLTGRILDPFHGIGDLEAKTLRTAGPPAERFEEDYLRVLRAFRFAGRFDLDIEDGTWRAACAVVDRLSGLSAERIRDELIKVLETTKPSRALELYAASGALRILYPELEARRVTAACRADEAGSSPSEWDLHVTTADRLPPENPHLRLAALLRGLPHSVAAAVLLRLRLSNVQIDRALRLATAADLPAPEGGDAEFRRWLSRTGPDAWPAAATLQHALATARAALACGNAGEAARLEASWLRARAVSDAKPPLAVGDLEFDGRDLIRLGLKPGPRFGTILEGLLEWVLEDPERNRHEVLAERVRGELPDE
jgi:tRNA nucleotidyltransferase (CCA-adding enzyme)